MGEGLFQPFHILLIIAIAFADLRAVQVCFTGQGLG